MHTNNIILRHKDQMLTDKERKDVQYWYNVHNAFSTYYYYLLAPLTFMFYFKYRYTRVANA